MAIQLHHLREICIPPLQLRTHVETEKLERTTLKQLVQRIQRDFALLQPHIEALDQKTANQSSPLVFIENKIKILEKRLSTETGRHNARLNSLQLQLSTLGDQIFQFEHSNCNFILWKVTSIKLVFESARLWYLKPGRENPPTTRLRSPVFRSHPYGYNFYLDLYPFGFAAAIGTWLSLSLSISPGEYDDILPWPVSKTIQIKVRDQLNPLNVWSQIIEPGELTRPTTAEFLQYQPFGTRISSRIRNFLKKPMAIFIMTLCTLKFLSLTPQYHLPSLLYFFLFRRAPQSFSTPCQWGELSR